MSVLAGKDGSIRVGSNKIGYIDNFSLSIEQGTSETSQFEDQWREFVGTAKGWSGSFSGTFDYGDTDGQKAIVDDLLANGGEVVLQFKTSMGLVLVGTADISNGSIGGSHGDKINVSFNFQGTGGFSKKMAAPVIRQTGNTVSIEAGPGATIYYTSNGDDPTDESTEYEEAFDITEDLTIKAIAVLDGYITSDVATKLVTYIS